MTGASPHLPPRTCRIDTYRKLASMRWLFFVISLSILASIAAALSTIAWVAPYTVLQSEYNLLGIDSHNNLTSQPSTLLVRQTKQRIMEINDVREKVNNFYPNQALVASAVLLSSDGWVVMHKQDYKAGQEKNWEAIDYQGLQYDISRVVYDPLYNLLYCKLTGQGFRIVSFVDWEMVSAEQQVWVVDEQKWQRSVLAGLVAINNEPIYSAWHPQHLYKLDPISKDNAVVMDSNGGLLGIIDENGLMIPGWWVEEQVGSLLEEQKIQYSGLPWQGQIVSGVDVEGKKLSLPGFFITKSQTKPGKESVGAGDLLLKINDKAINVELLAEQIFFAPEEFNVSIWRAGEAVEILVKKQKVSS